MTEPIAVRGSVLIWARRSATASVEDAAARTGQSVETIRDWEAERAHPTFAQLERLADEYGVSYNALLLPDPPSTPEPPPDFRGPSDREREPISRPTRRELRRARYLQRLVGEADVLPPTRLPHSQRDVQAPAIAREALRVPLDEQLRWRDAYEAFRAWRSAVTQLGVLVLQYQLPIDELRGLSIPAASDGPPVIVVNQSDAINARNFTLLHELGHLVLGHDGGICDPLRRVTQLPSGSLEARCNHFAGAVLVPSEHLRQQPEVFQAAAESDPDVVLELLGVLGRRYRVSPQVMWYRLRDTELVSAESFSALWPRLRPVPRARRPSSEDQLGLPRWKRAHSSYGPELLDGLFAAAERGVVTTTTLIRALNIGSSDIARLQGQPVE